MVCLTTSWPILLEEEGGKGTQHACFVWYSPFLAQSSSKIFQKRIQFLLISDELLVSTYLRNVEWIIMLLSLFASLFN